MNRLNFGDQQFMSAGEFVSIFHNKGLYFFSFQSLWLLLSIP